MSEIDIQEELIIPSLSEISIDHHESEIDFSSNSEGNNDFKFELDFGLALPFRYYCSNEDYKNTHSATVVKSVDTGTGKIRSVAISTRSNEGPLQAVESDVLVVLLTMMIEQKNDPRFQLMTKTMGENSQTKTGRVYYNLAEICRRLERNVGSSGRVKEAITRIRSQEIELKKIEYDPQSNKLIDVVSNHSIILQKPGRIRISGQGESVDKFREIFFVDLDSYITENMFKDYFSTIEQVQYVALGTGMQRRLLIFLNSKKASHGDVFTFEMMELVQVLGLDGKARIKRIVLDTLDKVKEKLGNFEYKEQQKVKSRDLKSECSNFLIFVEFKTATKELPKYGTFYQSLCDDYHENMLIGADIMEVDVEIAKREINTKCIKASGTDEIKYYKNSVNCGELVIDIVLWQMFYTSYKIDSFRAFARSLGEIVSKKELPMIPDGYRYFLYDRIEINKEKLVLDRIARIQNEKAKKDADEKEVFEKSFSKMYDEKIATSESYTKDLSMKARIRLEEQGITEETHLAFNLEVKAMMKDIYKEEFLNGKVSDYRDRKSELLASGKQFLN